MVEKHKMARLRNLLYFRQLALSVICLLLIVIFNSRLNFTRAENTSLTVATEPTFPPFEMSAPDGSGLKGFDIDLMQAIGQEAGFKLNFESLPFDGIIPALRSGKIDGAISAMTITAKRAQTVSFSRPYFKSGLAIAVKNSNQDIDSIKTLSNRKVAVQIGTTGAQAVQKIPDVEIITFDKSLPLLSSHFLLNWLDSKKPQEQMIC